MISCTPADGLLSYRSHICSQGDACSGTAWWMELLVSRALSIDCALSFVPLLLRPDGDSAILVFSRWRWQISIERAWIQIGILPGVAHEASREPACGKIPGVCGVFCL